jgi:hypothetical protein
MPRHPCCNNRNLHVWMGTAMQLMLTILLPGTRLAPLRAWGQVVMQVAVG